MKQAPMVRLTGEMCLQLVPSNQHTLYRGQGVVVDLKQSIIHKKETYTGGYRYLLMYTIEYFNSPCVFGGWYPTTS